jgi:hypothetical protein
MSSPEIDSPFKETKSKPLVWIIPSVVLHLVVLIVWLTLPEEAPREPTSRKMTINSAQAELLQRHVEDANLVVLQAQVTELQAIKQAMAQIRDNKMAQLRLFEQQMVMEAPQDATDLFTRLLESQATILTAYQQMLESVRASMAIQTTAKVLLENKQIEDVRPQLIEFKALWDDAKSQMRIAKDQIAQSFALINTAEVTLEWVSNTSIESQLSDLKSTLIVAQQANDAVGSDLYESLSWRPSQYLDDVITKGEEYRQFLAGYAQANIDGKLAVEAKRAEQQQIIETKQAAIEDLKNQQVALSEEIEALAKGEKTTLNQLNYKAKQMRTQLINLGKQRGNAENTLKKMRDFRPDHNAGKKVNQIYGMLNGIFVAEPSLETIADAMKAQVEFTQAAQSLLTAIVAQTPKGETVQP